MSASATPATVVEVRRLYAGYDGKPHDLINDLVEEEMMAFPVGLAGLVARITGVRKQLSQLFGFVVPQLRVRDALELAPDAYRILLGGAPLGGGAIRPERILAIAQELAAGALQAAAACGSQAGVQRGVVGVETQTDDVYRFACKGDRDLGAGEISHCGIDAAFFVRHAGEFQAHFDAGQSAHQCQVVEITEMADAEHLVGDFAEAAAQRHVEVFEHDFAEGDFAVAGGHHHRGQHR